MSIDSEFQQARTASRFNTAAATADSIAKRLVERVYTREEADRQLRFLAECLRAVAKEYTK